MRQAMVDLDCTQTLVHQTLVRPVVLLEAEWEEVRCAWRHPAPLLVVQLKL